MEIAVLGAGHGGLAMSADLKLLGHSVRLAALKEYSLNIKLLKAIGKITVEGITSVRPGPVEIASDFVKDDVVSAIKGAKIIFVNVPAFAQEVYSEYIAKFGEKGQIIVFPCGGFSALNFYNYLNKIGRENDFYIGETASFIYTTKITDAAKVLIKSIKEKIQFAAYPNSKTDEALLILNSIYPQFYKAENVWQTSFNNPSSVLHTITTLMNMSRIEQFGPYKNSYFDITPSVARIIEKVDVERLTVASNFYSNPMSMKDIMGSLYNIRCDNFYDTIKNIKAYQIQYSPDSLKHRYVSEDIPYSLVPISTLAKKLEIKTPNMDSIINIACMCNDINYWETGRNADKIGFLKKRTLAGVY